MNTTYTVNHIQKGPTLLTYKKVLPTKAQLAKCVTDAERQIAATKGV